jgi:hypothetical protein
MEKLIKNVRPKSWLRLKSEAAKHGLTISEFLEKLLEAHMKMEKNRTNWDLITGPRKPISKTDAELLKRSIAEFEGSYGFED